MPDISPDQRISQDTDGLSESFLISLTTADMTLSRSIKEMRMKKDEKTKRQKKCIYSYSIWFIIGVCISEWDTWLISFLTFTYKNMVKTNSNICYTSKYNLNE